MSEVCKVTMRVWQRKDGKWSCEARLKGPGERTGKISNIGLATREAAEEATSGDVNELVNGMGWERQDEHVD